MSATRLLISVVVFTTIKTAFYSIMWNPNATTNATIGYLLATLDTNIRHRTSGAVSIAPALVSLRQLNLRYIQRELPPHAPGRHSGIDHLTSVKVLQPDGQ